MHEMPWAAFCISTFKRPQFLRTQIAGLLKQTFGSFEIVISDNDPAATAKEVAGEFNDPRVRYFHNGDNLGMIRSFNKSIERATAAYVVMVTDDDPVDENLLADMHALYDKFPGHTIYGGFMRNQANAGPEVIGQNDFIKEILDPHKTPWLLWSSCVIKRDIVMANKCIPDYGSPHLADHALIVMAGSQGGGVIINKKYSSLSSHDSNFSKFNFDYYTKGCKGFYDTMELFCTQRNSFESDKSAILKHLGKWFIANVFNLKRYYAAKKYDPVVLSQVNDCAHTIMAFPFMKRFSMWYFGKLFVFNVKRRLGLLK